MEVHPFRIFKGITSFGVCFLTFFLAAGCGGGGSRYTQPEFRSVAETAGIYSRYESIQPQVINSRADLERLIAATDQNAGSGPLGAGDRLIDLLLSADVNYEKEALVLLRHTTAGGPLEASLEGPQIQGRTMVATIRTVSGDGGVGVFVTYFYVFAVSRERIDDVRVVAAPFLSAPETIRLTIPD